MAFVLEDVGLTGSPLSEGKSEGEFEFVFAVRDAVDRLIATAFDPITVLAEMEGELWVFYEDVCFGNRVKVLCDLASALTGIAIKLDRLRLVTSSAGSVLRGGGAIDHDQQERQEPHLPCSSSSFLRRWNSLR